MDIIATVMLFIILITTSANIVSCEEEDGLNRPTHCPLGQYYAMAIKQCRSCVYPCRIDRKACRAMGCADYEATTAASTRSNSEAVHVNDVNVDEHPMRQRRKRRKVRCELGEFYDVAIEQCRSCSIPCSLSSRVCHEMGCDGYKSYQTTTTLASTSSSTEVGTMLASSKSSAEVGIMARNNEFMYIIGGTGGASVLLFCVVIILAIWLIRLSREKKSKREKYMRVSYLNEKSEKEEKSLLKSNEQSTRSCLRDTTTVSVEETDETNMSVKNAGSDVEATDGSLV
ncbi:uncharacterized protein LOC135502865 isoform X2 [Lineus longissimus]|uniref:uncharacterized protein LOC135502865 isoform X2 n=1 Tax=Lineus longissimus TaxID=88925 RepID=UPI002B4DCE84